MERVKRHLRKIRRVAYSPVAAVRRLTFWQKMAILVAAVFLCATIDYALNYRRGDRPEPHATKHSFSPDPRGAVGTGSGSSHPILTAFGCIGATSPKAEMLA